MRRLLLTCLLALAILAALAVGLAAWLLQDEAFVKARLHAAVLNATGRELAIDGPLRIDPGMTTRIEAQGLRLQNAAWAQEPDMLQVGQLVLAVNLRSLFHETVVVTQLHLSRCKALFEADEAGRSNWSLLEGDTEADADGDGGPPAVLLDGQLDQCSLVFSSPRRTRPTEVEVDSFALLGHASDGWTASASGRVNGESLKLAGHMKPTGALVQGKPLEFGLEASTGQIRLEGKGSFENALEGRGANLDLRFTGPEIERVIDYFGLPRFSDGAFDFRLRLDAQGQMNRIDLDGDLGSLEAQADGELDRLVRPTRGRLVASLEGPNLGALAEVLGRDGLPQAPFSLGTDAGFAPGTVQLERLDLEASGSRLSARGALGTASGLAGTDLDLDLALDDASRLATVFDIAMPASAPLRLNGRLRADAAGEGVLSARAEYRENTLTVDGALGPLAGPLQPDLRVDFHSPDLQTLTPLTGDLALPARPAVVSGQLSRSGKLLHLQSAQAQLGGHRLELSGDIQPRPPFTGSRVDLEFATPDLGDFGELLGQPGFPRAPLRASGRVSRPDDDLKLEGVTLDLAGNTASLQGRLAPRTRLAGTELEGEIDSPNIAELAGLFGLAGLPPEPLQLGVSIAAVGGGLRIRTRPVTGGELKLAVDARIPDLNDPLGVEGEFDLALPSLQLVGFLAPNTELPDLPVTARGSLRNSTGGTDLDQVALQLGDLQLGLTGHIETTPDGGASGFDVRVRADVADVRKLQRFLPSGIRAQIPSDAFSLKTRLHGNPSAFALSELEARLGRSQAGGELTIGLGPRTRVAGEIKAPLIDLGWWKPAEAASSSPAADPQAEPAGASAFLFDDTPVTVLGDYGVDLDLGLAIDRLELHNTHLRDIAVHTLLQERHLEIQPFSLVGLQGGHLSGRLIADDRDGAAELSLDLDGESIRLGLLASENQDPSTFPETEIHLRLEGTGRTRREMASGLNGRLRIFSGAGQIASSVADVFLSDFLTQLLSALNPVRKDRSYTEFSCMAIGADIVDGRAEVGPVVVQTAEVTIVSDGKIDLRTEDIDLSFHTSPRKGLGISTATLANPFIKVGGKLAQPALELDPAGTVIKGGTAVATAGLSILARSLYDRFLSSRDPCGDARKELAKRDRS